MERLCLNYEGPFCIQVVSAFAKFLLENTFATELANKKLHRVFIELAQNVSLYSFDREQLINGSAIGKGNVYITEYTHELKCVTINKIRDEHAPILAKNCTEINAASLHILKARKRQLRKLSSIQDTGAHIGLIMICIYSGNPLEFDIFKTKEGDTYFKIAATINKI
jgi:hypothetical protein